MYLYVFIKKFFPLQLDVVSSALPKIFANLHQYSRSAVNVNRDHVNNLSQIFQFLSHPFYSSFRILLTIFCLSLEGISVEYVCYQFISMNKLKGYLCLELSCLRRSIEHHLGMRKPN